jgi:hypothetical protein
MASGNQDKLVHMGKAGRDAAEAVEELKSMFEAAQVVVQASSAERKECQELLLGEQWSRVRTNVTGSGDIVYERDLQGDGDMELLQNNVLADLLMNRVSQCVGGLPQLEALASTNEQADYVNAAATTKMIRPLLDHLKSKSFWRRLKMTAGMYNCSFGKVGWSKSMGPVVSGKPTGEVSHVVIPPFDIFPDPDCERVMPERVEDTDARWLFHRFTTTLDELKLIVKGEKAEKTLSGGDQIWCGLPKDSDITPYDGDTRGQRSAARLKNGDLTGWSRVECLAFYEFPTERHGRGRYCLMLPGNDNWFVNYRESLPHDTVKLAGLFPFIMTHDEQWPGQLAGRSRTKAAAIHQRIVNRRQSEREDLLSKIAPVTYYNSRMMVNLKGIQNVKGLGVMVPVEGPLEDLPETKWPSAVDSFIRSSIEAEARAIRGAEDRMGVHQLANYPRRAMTATESVEAMRYDQDNMTAEAAVFEECTIVPYVKLVLQMVMREYGDSRMVAYVGDRNRSEVMRIMASQIAFKDILIVGTPGSSAPRTRRQQKAEVLEAAKVGAFSSPIPEIAEKKMRWFLDLMQLESSIEMSGDEMDIKNARAENADMIAGKDIPPPQLGDNDPIHLYGPLCHMEMLKDPAFRNLDPGKKAAVLQVWQAHTAIHQMQIDEAAEELRQKNPNLVNPMAEIMRVALGRTRPGDGGRGSGVGGQGTGTGQGPVAMPPAAGQPIDFQRPDGTRVYQETKGPKTGNQVGDQKRK